MTQTFKKGAVVPRRIALAIAHNKRAQHRLKFGCDVTYDGNCICPLKTMAENESIIQIPFDISCKRKNGTRQKSGFTITKWRCAYVEGIGTVLTRLKGGDV